MDATFHFLVVIGLLLLIAAQGLAATGEPSASVPANLDVLRHFSFHGGRSAPGMWQALRDKGNDPILSRCVSGVTAEELAPLNIPDITQRLEHLQKVDLIRQTGETYTLAFPAVVGQTRHELQQKVHAAAVKLLPVVTSMIQEVKRNLAGREEMTFHVLWSVILDGSEAWQSVKAELAQEQPDADAAVIGQSTRWLVYPNHPHDVGTNSNSTAHGRIAVTWSPRWPDAGRLLGLVMGAQEQLIDASRSSQQVQGLVEADAAKLRTYGLVTKSGHSRLFIIDAKSPVDAAFRQMGASFGRQAVRSLDVSIMVSLLGTSPGLTTDIAYHQLCYEILRLCEGSGQLEIPQVSDNTPNQAYQLVSTVAFA